MRFGQFLLDNIVPEWKEFYINYKLLKSIIKKLVYRTKFLKHKKMKEIKLTQKSFSQAALDTSLMVEKDYKELSHKEEFLIISKFTHQLIIELKKVDFFFYENTKYYHNKIRKIKEQLQYISKHSDLSDLKKKYEEAIKQVYKEVSILRKYIDLNLQAKKKIMKKFMKLRPEKLRSEFPEFLRNNSRQNDDLISPLYDKISKFIDNLVKNSNLSNPFQVLSLEEAELEKIFAEYFFDKYNFEAIKNLKEFRSEVEFTQSQSFYFGFFIGILLIIFLLCILIGNHFHIDMDDDAKFKTIFPMFRGYLVMIAYYWFLGLNVYVWNNYKINYRLAFNFDSHYSPVISIFKRAAFFTLVVALMLLCYMIERTKIPILYDLVSFIPLEFTPLICYLFAMIYLFSPFDVFNYLGRLYTWNLFIETMASITTHSELRHTWLGDQMTSLVGPFRDIEYTVCYYTHYYNTFEEKKRLCSNRRPIVILIGIYPYTIRFMQVIKTMWEKKIIFPDILNAIKYILSILVAISSYYSKTVEFFNKTWLLIACFSSCWSYSWDMKMDYGLIQQGPNYPLRNVLRYQRKWVYYTAMSLNLMGRFAWVLTISPDVVYRWIRPEFFLMVIYLIEAFRRGMWNFFRIELRHIDLCKEFKVSDRVELPLKKIDENTFVIKNIQEKIKIEKKNKPRIERLRNISMMKFNINNEHNRSRASFGSINNENTNKVQKTENRESSEISKKETHNIVKKLNTFLTDINIKTAHNLDNFDNEQPFKASKFKSKFGKK